MRAKGGAKVLRGVGKGVWGKGQGLGVGWVKRR